MNQNGATLPAMIKPTYSPTVNALFMRWGRGLLPLQLLKGFNGVHVSISCRKPNQTRPPCRLRRGRGSGVAIVWNMNTVANGQQVN